MKYIVAPCADQLGYGKLIRADELPEPGRITSQIIELLNSADLVIADLSRGNPNVYYELSFRHAIGKAVIHMAVDGTRLSFDVADNRTIFYSMHARRVEKAKEDLTAQIKRVEEPGYKPRNPIADAIGLISLERSTEPTQRAIAGLFREVEILRGDVADLKSSLKPSQPTFSAQIIYPDAYVDQRGLSRVTGHYIGPVNCCDYLPRNPFRRGGFLQRTAIYCRERPSTTATNWLVD
jgi:hypothetical protein